MALPGEEYTQTLILSWTRGEFSTGSTTRVYESTTIGGLGSQIASVGSATTSKTVQKTIDSAAPTYHRYYRVKHALSNGTLSTQSNQVDILWGGAA